MPAYSFWIIRSLLAASPYHQCFIVRTKLIVVQERCIKDGRFALCPNFKASQSPRDKIIEMVGQASAIRIYQSYIDNKFSERVKWDAALK
ncbi:MAG: hypothetical protein MUO26_02815 [Methanotrichaceae archaeon]|nr:hypothetical protein [Methanotrichaceae archaeon]